MKKRIRFLINTLAGGGAEKVLVELLNQLDPDMYDITLVTVTGGVRRHDLLEHITVRQIVPSGRQSTLLAKLVYKLPPRLFAKLFLPGDFDIEIAYLEGSPTRFMAAKRTNGRKLAFVHCDLSVNNLIQSLYPSKEDCLTEYQCFDKICFVSQKSKKGFEEAIGPVDNGCVIHNMINIDRIRAMAATETEEEYRTNGLKLVTVGRLTAAKGYDRLLRIVDDLEKEFSFELWILGDGEERAALEKLIAERDIRCVRLLGYRENPYPLLRKADLFVCASLSEGYSTAVTEAMVLALPVITTDCAGMDEILEQGKYGLIVENSEQALKAGLFNLLQNPEEMEKLRAAALEKSQTMTNQRAMREYTELFS
ncbi:MAG: glycosyltransferase [Ruminococcaceae bacterium]|nr:glycosyltransferase [Oscillospiraceae bacterium]